jgi:hypothetical protein
MKTASSLSESTKDLQDKVFQKKALEKLEAREQAWFDEQPSARPSSVPPSGVYRLGEFLGDPLADAWLR